MKRILIWSVVSFLILFMAAPLAYTEPKYAKENIMERGGYHEGSSCGASLLMSGHIEHMKPSGMRNKIGIQKRLDHFLGLFMSLNFDEKQMSVLKEIESDATKEMIRKKADRQIAKIELQELLDKDTVDLKAVEKKLRQIENLKTESRLIIIKSTQKMKATLTSGQVKMLKKIKPMGHPGMRPSMKGEMMCDESKMPPPSDRERGE